MSFWRQLRSLVLRRRLDREMRAEMEAHLDALALENIAVGMSPEEARLAAQRRFGGTDQIRERALDARGGRWLEEIARTVRHAARSLVRSPVFTGIAIVSLAFGIGANTAVFSLVNGILLRSLPVPDPQDLRLIEMSLASSQAGGDEGAGERRRTDVFPYSGVLAVQEAARPHADVAGYANLGGVNARIDGTAFTTQGLFVTGNYCATLRLGAQLGRTVVEADDKPESPPSVMISERWWRHHFDSAPDVLGRTVRLNEATFTIVGVLPGAYHGAHEGDMTEFLIPVSSLTHIDDRSERGTPFASAMRLIARPHTGVRDAVVEAAVQGVLLSIPQWKPADDPRAHLVDGTAGPDMERSYFREPLLLLSAAVASLMLLACANLGGLSLVRAVAREREHAIRSALGCGRGRLVANALVENLLLATAGAVLGLVVIVAARTYLAQVAAGTTEGLRYDTSVDGRVLIFTIGTAFVTALLTGLLPAWRAGRTDPIGGLKAGDMRSPRGLRLVRLLVGAQVALSLLLLTATGLYVRTFVNCVTVDPGVPVDQTLSFRLKARSPDPAVILEFHARTRDEIARLPGVVGVATANFKPLNSRARAGFYSLVGDATKSAASGVVQQHFVGETFFETLEIPIVAGRFPVPGEQGVVVVNEAFVRQFSPATDPCGQMLRSGNGRKSWHIVGVCRDARMGSVRSGPHPGAFFSIRESTDPSNYYIVRSTLGAGALKRALVEAIARVDPAVAPAALFTHHEVREKSLRREGLLARLVTTLALIALGLSCIGLYGLMAFGVARRTREFGVRLALGARPGEVAWPVVREALVVAAGGLVVGLVAALASGRFLASQLYGVSPRDPATLVGATVLLLAIAVIAAWRPARRAARVDPIIALRSE
ncbi:MAG: ABC transporter permease [Opitutaceae bacterium]|nr:ABC transporter permease [Opitutaceae bacterium]